MKKAPAYSTKHAKKQRLMMKKQFIDIIDLFVSEVKRKSEVLSSVLCTLGTYFIFRTIP